MADRAPHLLLVDDSPVVVEVISANLDAWGISCDTAQGGQEAVALFAENVFDAVLLDIGLPDIGGLQVLSRMRERAPDVPIIMLTSYAEIDCVLTAVQHGAFDYVMKDEEIEAPLRAAINRAVAHVRLMRRNMELLEQLRTEQAQHEDAVGALKRTQVQLVRAERMAAVGVLTAAVAHEVSGPLAFIIPGVEVLGDFCQRATTGSQSADAEAREVASQCREGLQRIRRVVERLSAYSHPAEEPIEPLDLEHLLRRALTLLKERIDTKRIRTRLSLTDVGPVAAAQEQLQKAVLHLLNNAAEAVGANPGGGEIAITTRRRGHRIEIRIADNGRGIPPEQLPKVFDPFFTTKPPGEGTGLGLSVSRSLVELMGGTIELESALDKGTTVRVSLPLYDHAMAGQAL